jgi:hypothetical protein
MKNIKELKYKDKIYGWEDCCPLCGNVNISSNTCGLCGFKWKKGYVYYSNTNVADWKSGSGYINIENKL